MLVILIGATGGFLVYNFHPASIFMGDSGSLLLGFAVSAATLTTQADNLARPDVISIVAAPVLVLLIPIFDTTLVTMSRILSGRSAAQGGRDHSSHRLVAIGLSERNAVAVLWLLAAIGGTIGVWLDYLHQGWASLAAAGFVIVMVLFAVYLFSIRVYEEGDTRVEQGALTPLLVDLVYKRRVAEVVLDLLIASACYYAAYRLRFEDPEDFMKNFGNFTSSFPLVIGVQMVAFFVVGVYRGVWRHFGMNDALVITRGIFFGARDVAALHPLRLSLLQLFAHRVRDLCRPAADLDDAGARVVAAGRRVHPAAAAVRPPRRHLRRRRRRHVGVVAVVAPRRRVHARAGLCR